MLCEAMPIPDVVVPILLNAIADHDPLVVSASPVNACVVPLSTKNAATMHSPIVTDTDAPIVSAVAVAPAALVPPVLY